MSENTPIKFKVWDKIRKVFAKQITTYKLDRNNNIYLVVYLDKANKIGEIYEDEKIYCNAFELMRFTGLKDKNGKEIYEGDILKYKSGRMLWDDELIERIDKISWNESELCFWVGEYPNGFKPNMETDNNSFEVIGNVTQNLELLTQKTF